MPPISEPQSGCHCTANRLQHKASSCPQTVHQLARSSAHLSSVVAAASTGGASHEDAVTLGTEKARSDTLQERRSAAAEEGRSAQVYGCRLLQGPVAAGAQHAIQTHGRGSGQQAQQQQRARSACIAAAASQASMHCSSGAPGQHASQQQRIRRACTTAAAYHPAAYHPAAAHRMVVGDASYSSMAATCQRCVSTLQKW